MSDPSGPQSGARQPLDKPAAGPGSVASMVRRTLRDPGALRGMRALLQLNQAGGYDCPGCAWPEPEGRWLGEFCENGAKHVGHEATKRRVTSAFFAQWTISKLLEQTDQWLEAQGRLTQPMRKRAGSDKYEQVSWKEAFEHIATVLRALDSPNEALFYTSGRTSNEAAFLYQLFVRLYGTNNLPDCSHMCHESTSAALPEVVGEAKGTVGLADFERADAIFLIGQNPGTNHPRMLATLQQAKRRGCRIVSINPLRERGLVSFAHPKELRGLLGRGTAISDLYLQVRVGGDVAILKGIMKGVLEAEARAPGTILDHAFIREYAQGFEAYRDALDATSWEAIEEHSGLAREQMCQAAEIYTNAERVIACWAMGITQHKHAISNVQEIVNLMLLRGNIGKPGAGLCPVRGHSNVQGDRTMGICEKPKPEFLKRLGDEFGFEPPAEPGFTTVGAIRAMAEGRAKVFFALGGNFAMATPDTAYTSEALRSCRLSIQVSTKLNRSHLVVGEEAIILPCLGRTERDLQGDVPQFVTVENSMRVVHRSRGRLPPASEDLRSEPAIVAGLAEAVLGSGSQVPWRALVEDYDRIRDRIARVVPGFENFNQAVRGEGGIVLPSGPGRRDFATASGRANFSVHPLPVCTLEPGQFLMTTIRSHDQFNTTVYSSDDRYRGIRGNRRVVFLHSEDMAEANLKPQQLVDLTSHFEGETRVAAGFRAVPYDLPRHCAATYFPEANALVPVGSVADRSQTPTYKSVVITLSPAS